MKERKNGRMSDIFRFRGFPVYDDARQFRKELKKISKEEFPSRETGKTIKSF